MGKAYSFDWSVEAWMLFIVSDQYYCKVNKDQVSNPTAEMTVYLASPLPPAPALPLLYTYSGPALGTSLNQGPPASLSQGPALSVPSATHLAPDCPGTDNVCEYRQDTYPHNLGNLLHTEHKNLFCLSATHRDSTWSNT